MKKDNFFRFVWFDFRTGLVHCRKLFLLLAGISLMFAMTYLKMMGQQGMNAGFLDCYFFIMKGRDVYERTVGIPFELPLYWIIMYILFYGIIMYIVRQMMCTWNGQEFIYLGRRKLWWYSKCLCCLAVLLMCFVTLIVSIVAAEVLSGYGICLTAGTKGIVEIICIPFLSTYTLGIVQLYLSARFDEKAGFLFVVMYLTASVYFYQKLLIGNYMIPLRHLMYYPEGYRNPEAVLIPLIFLIIVVICGKRFIEKNERIKRAKL